MATGNNEALRFETRSSTNDTWRSHSSTFTAPVEKTVSFGSHPQSIPHSSLTHLVGLGDISGHQLLEHDGIEKSDSWRSQSASFQAPTETTVGRAPRLLCTPVTRFRYEVKTMWTHPESHPESPSVTRPLPTLEPTATPPLPVKLARRMSGHSHSGRSKSFDSLNLEKASSAARTRSWDSLNLEVVPREGKRKATEAIALSGAVAVKLNQEFKGSTAEQAAASVPSSRMKQRRMSVPAVPVAIKLSTDLRKPSDTNFNEEDEPFIRRVRSWPEFGAVTGCLDALLQEPEIVFPSSENSRKSMRKSVTAGFSNPTAKKGQGRRGLDDHFRGVNFLRWRLLRSLSKASSLSSATSMSRFFRRAGTAFSSLSSNGSIVAGWLWWNESAQAFFGKDGEPISFGWTCVLFASIMALAGAFLLLLSDIVGCSVHLYLLLIRCEILSMPLLGIAGLGFVFLHVTDVYSWQGRVWKRLLPIVCNLYVACIGIVFMTKSYPEVPFIVFLLHFPMWIGGLRVASSGYWSSQHFHVVFARCCGATGVIVSAVWMIWMSLGKWQGLTERRLREDMHEIFEEYDVLNWDRCLLERDVTMPQADVLESCARIELFAFLAWTCPAIESAVLLSIAVFLALRATHLTNHLKKEEDDDVAQQKSDIESEDKSLKRIVFLIFVFIGAAWAAGAIAGSSMGLTNTVFLALGAGALVLFIWFLGSVRLVDVIKTAHKSLAWKILRPFAKSDWTKALTLCCTALFVVAFLALECVTRLFQRLFRVKKGPLKYTTARGAWLMNIASHWHVASVLTKAWWLSILFLLIWVVCTKVALVLLSWMIDYSKRLHWLSVLGLFYGVAIALFLCPTMPVVPIYMSAGILIVARLRQEIGFAWAVTSACGLCLVLKLNACALQQKLFGQGLGHFTSVRRIVGLHTVATRAVELILQQPGFTFAKVAVLVGGPDWPTSVLTGIMGLSLPQMLLGTLPVIFLILPTVLAGSCLLDDEVKKFSPLVTGIMGVAHGSTFIAALVLTARVAINHHAELQRPRPEHAALEQLAKVAEQWKHTRMKLTYWEHLSITQRTSLTLAVASVLGSCWITTLLSSSCFRSFGLDSDIHDTFEEGGLDGNAWNLLQPLGYGACFLILAGIALFIWYELESAYRLCRTTGLEDSMSESEDVDGESGPEAQAPPRPGVPTEHVFSPRPSEGQHEDAKSPECEHARPEIMTPRTPTCITPTVVSPRESEPMSPQSNI